MSSIFEDHLDEDTSGHFELFPIEGEHEETIVITDEEQPEVETDISSESFIGLFEPLPEGDEVVMSHEGKYKSNDWTSLGRGFDAVKAARQEVQQSEISHGFKRKTSEEMADEYESDYQEENRKREEKEAEKQARAEEKSANRAQAKEDLKEGMKNLGGALVEAAKATGKGVKETARIAYNLALGKSVGA